jgi:hypothetical protein
MRNASWVSVSAVAILAAASTACSPSLQQPFDQIKAANSNMTAFRLQNYEAPPQQNPQAGGGLQLPAQIQQYVQMAQQMLPPGLLQGLIPGLGGSSAPQPQPDAPRFHDFRILGYVPVSDPKNRDAIFDLFGHASNFTAPKDGCMFAEFGFRLAEAPNPQAQPADVLVSLSCNQVRGFGFVWPYGNNTALTPDAWKKMHDIIAKSFGGG